MVIPVVCALAALAAPQTFSLPATDDIWIYHFAQEQVSDPYLRCWGSQGTVASDPNAGGGESSWSCIKFDMSSVKQEGELKSAVLTIWLVAGSALGEEETKKWPVEIRAVSPQFNESNFQVRDAKSVLPDTSKAAIFGTASPQPTADEKPVKVEIDLMKGPAKFAEWFKKCHETPNKSIAFAMTTTLDPQEAGEGQIYKFHSRNGDKTLVPELKLTFN